MSCTAEYSEKEELSLFLNILFKTLGLAVLNTEIYE